MCGIVGYIGYREAQPLLVSCLKQLQYRGYDSCGIAVVNSNNIILDKDIGTVDNLEKKMRFNKAKLGVGHTRWATHGKVTQINAHPHLDCTGKIAVVHNGVIENYFILKEQLIREGHKFISETDSEVIPHLIEKYFEGNLKEAVQKAVADLQGSFAIVVVHQECKELIAARQESPLIIGIGDHENFAASDVPALLNFTDRVMYPEDGDIISLTTSKVSITKNGSEVTRKESKVEWTVEDAQKSGYEHYMLKEIHEQPRVIQNSLRGAISSLRPESSSGLLEGIRFNSILFLACGTSYHASLLGEYLVNKFLKIPTWVKLSSEFLYCDLTLSKCLAIGITQSGETMDTIKALAKARQMGCPTLAITNVTGSSITRVADYVHYIMAGPEISVAATKSFLAQCVALYTMSLLFSKADLVQSSNLLTELKRTPTVVQEILDREDEIKEIADWLANYKNIFYVGRGINYPVAMEGALKLKEISYLHAEAYAAGELKHGPLALIRNQTPVVAIAPQDETYNFMISNIKEIKAREAPVLAIADSNDNNITHFVDIVFRIPEVNRLFSPIANTVVLQLLAYYTAKKLGCAIDLPSNLAKSVTVI